MNISYTHTEYWTNATYTGNKQGVHDITTQNGDKRLAANKHIRTSGWTIVPAWDDTVQMWRIEVICLIHRNQLSLQVDMPV